MSVFTLPLWEVIKIEGDTGNGARIGLDRYPIFDPAYRDGLNRKIIQEFWNQEIGQETISMFTFALARRMNQIMPYWNQVYKSALLELDPFNNVDLVTIRDDTVTENGSSSGNQTGNVKSTTGGRTVNSDTPQTMLSEDEDYASTGSDVNSAATTNSATNSSRASTSKTENDGKSSTKGHQGYQADALLKVRATFINTDMLVIDQLRTLFMGVFETGEEILPQRTLSYLSIGLNYDQGIF